MATFKQDIFELTVYFKTRVLYYFSFMRPSKIILYLQQLIDTDYQNDFS